MLFLGCAKASTEPEELAVCRPSGKRLTGVEMDGISWKELKK